MNFFLLIELYDEVMEEVPDVTMAEPESPVSRDLYLDVCPPNGP